MEGDDRTFRVNFSSDGATRLREQVTDKLKEFMGDYTDDTLVEYVIVLLKNGRRKDEAKSELNVFLGDDDSDSFVSWLWDHLGSNVSLYVQPQELRSDGVEETKSAAEEQVGRGELHLIDSEAGKGNSDRTTGHHHDRERKELVKEGSDNEVPLLKRFMADNRNAQNESLRRVSRTKSLSPLPKVQKKRRRPEVHHPRKSEVSQSTVGAPRRLLQFAVRDAVATSRPSNSASEPSVKRLRSVVATSTRDAFVKERPKRIRPVAEMRTSMSAAIKAVAEAVKDASRIRPPGHVFDRFGHGIDASNCIHRTEYEGFADEVDAVDFGVEMENFHPTYHPESDDNQEEANITFHGTVMDSDLGYHGDDYDDFDVRRRETISISQTGTSGGNWADQSLVFQYGDADDADDGLHRPHEDLGEPATLRHKSLKISSSVSMNARGPPQYLKDREVSEMNNNKIMQGNETIFTKSKMWLMKENSNPTVAFNGNGKRDVIQQQSQKIQAAIGLQNTTPSAEDADSRSIFLSNVHFAATKDSLSWHFNKFGEVLKVTILTDLATGLPKGSAYVEFMRKEAAELALSLDGTSFMSRPLKVVMKCAAQPETSSVMTWTPSIARASSFIVPWYGRPPLARGIASLYRARTPIKLPRSFQWKRAGNPDPTGVQPPPAPRSLTYVRAEPKANGNSSTA